MAAVLLADYFADVRKRRWKYGDLDCSTFMSDWAMLCGLQDPMRGLRGRYHDQKSYLRLVRAEGGFVAACEARLTAIGMRETSSPIPGDLLVVEAPFAEKKGRILRRATGAIAAEPRRAAVITSDLGLLISGPENLPIVKAWTF